jgi:hypothetical protein
MSQTPVHSLVLVLVIRHIRVYARRVRVMAAMAAHFSVTAVMVLPVAMVAMQAKLAMAVTAPQVLLE